MESQHYFWKCAISDFDNMKSYNILQISTIIIYKNVWE